MKRILTVLTFALGIINLGEAQTTTDTTNTTNNVPQWTETDRKYLLDNLIRAKEEIIAETKNLTTKQWNFKESPERWSINQIIEHICIWELIQMNEISTSLQMGPLPDFTHNLPDSLFIDPDPNRLKKDKTTEYTKPFTYSVPLGNNEGKNNVIWLTTMRNESIEFLKNEKRNIRVHYICFGPNIHQRYMMVFQHNFKHLQQIKEIRKHPKYPK